MTPTRAKKWVLSSQDGFEKLSLEEGSAPELGDYDVLVEIEAAALNYRDLAIPNGSYPRAIATLRIPVSDACGAVVFTGKKATRFSPGEKFATHFYQGHLSGSMTPALTRTGLGSAIDGALTKYAFLHEEGLVLAHSNLNPIQASALLCAALAAWNSLYGLLGRALKPGDFVLTQGYWWGAVVIATTSSEVKAGNLKDWAQGMLSYQPPGRTELGVNHVIEVGGQRTLAQSLKAIKMEGVISEIGFLEKNERGGGKTQEPSAVDAITANCIIRGITVGSRSQFEDMNRAFEANGIEPLIDKVFEFENGKKAYQHMWGQRHFVEVVIKVN